MGALDVDTAVVGRDGQFVGQVTRDWEIWGPNGGFLAALALRAAGAHTDLRRPASFSCHFLGVADFDAVDLSVRTLRRTKRAESIAVSMTQYGAPVLEAMVWVVGDVDGLEHDAWTAPSVDSPRGLMTIAERAPDQPMFAFWNNLECRPCGWIDDWDNRPAGVFHENAWLPVPSDGHVRRSLRGRGPFVARARHRAVAGRDARPSPRRRLVRPEH